MMRFLAYFLIIFTFPIAAQNAADYFPSQQGYEWNYVFVPLDSANNEIDSLTFFRADSFSVITSYEGRNSNLVLTKIGTTPGVNNLPYNDSIFYSFENSFGYEYLNVSRFDSLVNTLDSLFSDSSFSFLSFFRSLENWYQYYRFASPVNQSYQVFRKDTTIQTDSLTLPLRFEVIGNRLDDEFITTDIGSFNCKKFLMERRLSYLVLIPPFPPIAIRLIGIEETLWIAPQNWIVKSYTPSSVLDLTQVGFGVFIVPGVKMDIQQPITGVDDINIFPENFLLEQNYPNPFNPATKIKWQAVENGWQTLKIYDVLGNEITTLIDEYRPAGNYEIEFRADLINKNLSSGIYFYTLITNGKSLTKKMVLLK